MIPEGMSEKVITGETRYGENNETALYPAVASTGSPFVPGSGLKLIASKNREPKGVMTHIT